MEMIPISYQSTDALLLMKETCQEAMSHASNYTVLHGILVSTGLRSASSISSARC